MTALYDSESEYIDYVKNDDLTSIKMLYDCGYEISAFVLMEACQTSKNLEMIDYLFYKCPKLEDYFELACSSGNIEVVERLFELGSEISPTTLIAAAVEAENLDVVKELCSRVFFNVAYVEEAMNRTQSEDIYNFLKDLLHGYYHKGLVVF